MIFLIGKSYLLLTPFFQISYSYNLKYVTGLEFHICSSSTSIIYNTRTEKQFDHRGHEQLTQALSIS